MGLRASDTAAIRFENCRIPAENQLGALNAGFPDALRTLEGGRISIAAVSIGLAQAALDASVTYAKAREQFGQPIAQFQAIQFMLADMATELAAARLLACHAAAARDAESAPLPPPRVPTAPGFNPGNATGPSGWGAPTREGSRGSPLGGTDIERPLALGGAGPAGAITRGQAASMAKLFASEMATRAALKAVQIHGGYGYLRGVHVVERLLRDTKFFEIGEGTSEIQRLVIARDLLKE
jgi:alkylation response protein AidB-like acyl-CoA dehydrogenase